MGFSFLSSAVSRLLERSESSEKGFFFLGVVVGVVFFGVVDGVGFAVGGAGASASSSSQQANFRSKICFFPFASRHFFFASLRNFPA